jgi:hypothetical protein
LRRPRKVFAHEDELAASSSSGIEEGRRQRRLRQHGHPSTGLEAAQQRASRAVKGGFSLPCAPLRA